MIFHMIPENRILIRLHSETLAGERFDATESERAAGWRAMVAANAILRDQKQGEDSELCGLGISYANRRLRGECEK